MTPSIKTDSTKTDEILCKEHNAKKRFCIFCLREDIEKTQSKIIQIIDKRIEDLKLLSKASGEKHYRELVTRYDNKLEELESLKKEVKT